MKIVTYNGETFVCEDAEEALGLLASATDTTVVDGAFTPERLTAFFGCDVAFTDLPEAEQVDALYDFLTDHVDVEAIARETVLAERELCHREAKSMSYGEPTASDSYEHDVADVMGDVLDTQAWESASSDAYLKVEEMFVTECRDRISELWSDGYGDISPESYDGVRIPKEQADEQYEEQSGGLGELFG